MQKFLEEGGSVMRCDGEILHQKSEIRKRKLSAETLEIRKCCKTLLGSLKPWLKVCHEVFFLWKSRHFHSSIFEGELNNV